jgi:hypothetical protein
MGATKVASKLARNFVTAKLKEEPKMSIPESLRSEILAMMNGIVVAERERCAKIADNRVRRCWDSSAQDIADEIRSLPPFQLPPMAFETKSVRPRDLVAPYGRKRR